MILKNMRRKGNIKGRWGILILTLVLALSFAGCETKKLDNVVKSEGSSDDWMAETGGETADASTPQETPEDTQKVTPKETPEPEFTPAEEDEYFDPADSDKEVDYSKYEKKNTSQEGSGGSSGGSGEDQDSTGGVTYSDGSETEQDEYQTDPVPEGMPNPVEPGDVDIDTAEEYTCFLSISCLTILDNMDQLREGKEDLVPSDGVIYEQMEVSFYEGETVFDVLLRETQNNRIHMEYSFTPKFNSNYVEGINNLYERDCGSNSGWMFCVNGWYPNYGCSRYVLQPGDVIEWNYTCDLGRDLGQDWM